MLSVRLYGHLNQFSQPNRLGTSVCLDICASTVDLPISPVGEEHFRPTVHWSVFKYTVTYASFRLSIRNIPKQLYAMFATKENVYLYLYPKTSDSIVFST